MNDLKGKKRKVVEKTDEKRKRTTKKSSESKDETFAYTYENEDHEFEYNEVNSSSVLEELCDRKTTYEPCLATEAHLKLGNIIEKHCVPHTPVPHPLSTELDCLNCGGSIDGIPWLIPVARREGYFVMGDGCFCGFPCGMRHIADKGDFHASLQASLFADYANRYRSLPKEKMTPAGPRKMLDRYSKTGISLEEYRGAMCDPDLTVCERLQPFIPSTIVFEKKHSNQARWHVRGIRLPTKDEVERIYKEERVVGPQPFPGQTALYERYYQAYETKSAGGRGASKPTGPMSHLMKSKRRKKKKDDKDEKETELKDGESKEIKETESKDKKEVKEPEVE